MSNLHFASENFSQSESFSDFNHLPIEFHQNFLDIFNFSVSDFSHMKFDHHFIRGKIDEKYLANMLLKGDISLWKNVFRSNYPLTDELSGFQKTFEDIKRYFMKTDYSAEDLHEYNGNFSAIINYLTEKFPKTSLVSDDIKERADQIIVNF